MFYINEIKKNLRQTFVYAFVNFSIFFCFSGYFYNLLLINIFFKNLNLSTENKEYFISTHPNEILVKCFNIAFLITIIYTLVVMLLNFIGFLIPTFTKNLLFFFTLIIITTVLFNANLQYILLTVVHTTLFKFLQYDYNINNEQFIWVEPNPTIFVFIFSYSLCAFSTFSTILTFYIVLNSLLKLQIFVLIITIFFTLKLAFFIQLILLVYFFLLLYVLLFKVKKITCLNKAINQN